MMFSFVALVFGVVFIVISGTKSNAFRTIYNSSTNETVDLGGTVMLIFNVRYTGDKRDELVSWSKQEIGVDSEGTLQNKLSEINRNDDRFSIHCHDDRAFSLRCSLEIKNVNKNDTGVYVCSIRTSTGEESDCVYDAVELYVRDPSIITYISENQTKNVGESAEMVCKSDSRDVFWVKVDSHDEKSEIIIAVGTTLVIKDNRFALKFTKPGSYKLQLKDVRKTDSGVYKCGLIYKQGGTEFLFEETSLQVN